MQPPHLLALPLLLLPCVATSAGEIAPPARGASATITHRAEIRVGIENLTLPGNESMGLLGSSYLVEAGNGIYLGPAAYGAIRGQRGGFFTVGAELAWRRKLASRLEFEAGLFGGGGGGRAAQVGGGLMLRPHVDLMWVLGKYRAGLSASRVRFANGGIDSRQVGLAFSADSDFTAFSPALAGESIDYLPHSGVGFDRVLFTAGAYRPRAGSVAGANPPTIGIVGARFEQFFTSHWYRGIEAVGAASGGVAGYAEFLGTLGYETPIVDDDAIGARASLGMGGGGGIASGGGTLLKAGLCATAATGSYTHIALESGYAWAPGGSFRAPYGSANLVWDLDHPYASSSSATVVENEWVMGTTHLLGAARKDGSSQNLDAVVIRLNRYLTGSTYLTGQAYSAYRGNAGAYSAGLVGAGYRIPPSPHNGLYAGFEILGGAAGGGGVDTSGGAVIQPGVYAGMRVSPTLGIRLDAGRIKSLKGRLNSNMIGLSLAFDFGTARR